MGDKRKANIVAMSMSTVGAVLNMAVVLAIITDPLKVLRKGSWITILSLEIADLFTCISGFFLWGRTFFFHKPSDMYKGVINFSWAFGYSSSFLMLTFLTVQIFIVTKYPFKSRCWLTTTKIILFGIGHWLFAILLGLSNLAYLHFHWQESLKIYIVQYGILELTTIVQVVLHIQVAVEIVKSGRHINENVRITKHKKIAKTTIILTLILFVTAFPYFLLKQFDFFARLEYFGRSETGQIFYAISYYCRPIAMINFVANPILYSLRLSDYRNSLLALVGIRSRNAMRNSTTSKPINEFMLRSRETCGI